VPLYILGVRATVADGRQQI